MTLAVPIILTPKQIARFHSNVDRRGPDECWNWKLSRRSDGYGCLHVWVNEKQKTQGYGSHRVAYFIAFGQPPIDLQVCHKCDNKLCCNPSHFFLGTHKDNADDRERKGRGKPPAAEESGAALFTNQQVVEIKLRLAMGEKPKVLTKEFGCNLQTIYDIQRGRTWTSVGPILNYKPKRLEERCGESNPFAKLTDEQVVEIRKRYVPYETPARILAGEYNVSTSTLLSAATGRTWKHVKEYHE